MPEFAWRALNAKGEEVQGRAVANSTKDLLSQLQGQGLLPLGFESEETRVGMAASDRSSTGSEWSAQVSARPAERRQRGPVTRRDIFHFLSELSVMLKSGLSLDNALRLLRDMSGKPDMSQLIENITNAVKNGETLSKALADRGRHFDEFVVNMVRSGEASGQLANTLSEAVLHLERQRALRESVTSALIYPIILLLVAVLSLVAMLGFVVPQFQNLFDDLGSALPLSTQLVVALGQVFKLYWPYLLIMVLFTSLTIGAWFRTEQGVRQKHRVLLRLPLIGNIAFQYQLSLFARSMGTLLGNGVPLLRAVQIATDTVGNTTIRDVLAKMPAQIKSGVRMSACIQGLHLFDPLSVNLVKVGEETGRLGAMFLEMANLLSRDVEQAIKRSLTLLEPLLILVLGGLIAAIIVSILLGILAVNDLAL